MHQLGFMQGRLVDQVDGKIQAFPWSDWQLEFPRAHELGLSLIEWTLDDDRMLENPFISDDGQKEVMALSAANGIKVSSLTGDCFMQAPFWKVDGTQRAHLLEKLDIIINAAARLSAQYVVMPLVDAGRLESTEQRRVLIEELLKRTDELIRMKVQIIFETDYGPLDYKAFIAELPSAAFNINYDTGNSASLGFDSGEEFSAYGERIVNVHVKDRLLGGTTVPLGTGSANFERIFAGLAALDYQGNFILQTARAADRNHSGVLARYISMTKNWIRESYGS
jgi:hexulose-6-phosphate isomerase